MPVEVGTLQNKIHPRHEYSKSSGTKKNTKTVRVTINMVLIVILNEKIQTWLSTYFKMRVGARALWENGHNVPGVPTRNWFPH